MASEDSKVDGQGVGFAGLSSMVSDVDAALEGAVKSRPTSTSSESASSEPSSKSNPEVTPAVSNPTASGSGGKWIFGIGAVLGLIWLISISNNKSTSPQKPPTYSPQTSYSTPAPAYVAPPASPSRPSETLPPVGTNLTLNSSQIRYCVAEDIRLEAAKIAINNNVDVDRFNAMVSDYNSRCANYRYKRGSLEAVQTEIASFRGQLESEGRSRMSRASNGTPEQKSKVTEAPKPDLTTQAIQRRLNKFGYDAGEEDGLEGQQTRSAIEAFQRDQNLHIDGTPTTELLRQLSEFAASSNSKNKANPTPTRPLVIEEPARVVRSRSDVANFNSCIDGRYPSLCNHALLTVDEAAKVDIAERRANFTSCIDGRYPSLCNHQLLTPEQGAQVNSAERRANFNSCIDGRYPSLCNHALLTADEVVKVDAAERRANYASCIDGRYPSLCNHNILSSEQASRVRDAEARATKR